MNILVLLAHPDPASFNHAIAQTVCDRIRHNGHQLIFHDLYAECFDPLLPVEEIASDARLPESIARHCQELMAADGVVVVHPNWWGQPPAILKGWVDRVVRPKVAYQFDEGDDGEGIPVGLLKARSALVFNTSNTPGPREETVFGDPLERLWRDCIFDLCGVAEVARRMFRVMVTSTAQQRAAWLTEATELVDRHYPAA